MDFKFYLSNDLLHEVQPPEQGILSRTLHNDDQVKIVQFGFSPGQELSAHTAPFPATIQILQGNALLTLGDTQVEAGPGTLAHMSSNLSHAIVARTPVVMLLTMFKGAREQTQKAA